LHTCKKLMILIQLREDDEHMTQPVKKIDKCWGVIFGKRYPHETQCHFNGVLLK